MKVIVVGGGKVGFYLAQTLMEHGHQPAIIEIHQGLCSQIANQLDIPVYCGDGTTIDMLQRAGAANADALISVTGKDENNLIACQLAKMKFNVARTVARVNNPKNVSVMRQLGVDIPISSTDNIARLLEREVDTSAIKQIMSLNRGETSLSEITVPENFKLHGRPLSEINFPEHSIIVTITRGEEQIIPRGNTTICRGDKLVIIAKNTAFHQIGKIIGVYEK